MNEALTNITIKLPAEDWRKMAELYGKNRAEEIRKAIRELIKKKTN
jgi:metal-responsive CopG/Arc/MetJ family transcriptional regulator